MHEERLTRPMFEPFDPYRKWLGIPPSEQPPHHYRLLGIAVFEDDPDVIDHAADRQMVHIRTFQHSQHAAVSQRLLTELSAARICLLTPERKVEYDAQLRQRLASPPLLSLEQVSLPEPTGPPSELPPTFRAAAPGAPMRLRSSSAAAMA